MTPGPTKSMNTIPPPLLGKGCGKKNLIENMMEGNHDISSVRQVQVTEEKRRKRARIKAVIPTDPSTSDHNRTKLGRT